MRIVFIGNVKFSEKILQRLIALRREIAGVATTRQSKFNTDFCDLGKICRQRKIPCRYVNDINDSEHIEWIAARKPDIIFCFGFSQLLSREILRIPPWGAVGYHAARLPQNRGRHPIVWALALGLRETASTFFFMNEEADQGDILSQKRVPIYYHDDARSLYDRITKTAMRQIEIFLPQLEKGTYERVRQDGRKSHFWRSRSREDGRIDFRMNSRTIYNLVRALTRPYAGAHVTYRGRDIKVWRVQEGNFGLPSQEYGKVVKVKNNQIYVKCAQGGVVLVKHEFKTLPKAGDYLL